MASPAPTGFPTTIAVDVDTARVLGRRLAAVNARRAARGLGPIGFARFCRMVLAKVDELPEQAGATFHGEP